MACIAEPLQVARAVVTESATHATFALMVRVAGAESNVAARILLVVQGSISAAALSFADAAFAVVDLAATLFPRFAGADFAIAAQFDFRLMVFSAKRRAFGRLLIEHALQIQENALFRRKR